MTTLVPLLRQVTSPASACRAALLDPERAPIRRPAGPLLHLLVAIEDGELLRYVSPARCLEWGLSADEVFARALAGVEPQGLAAPAAPWILGGDAIFAMPNARAMRIGAPGELAEMVAWAAAEYRDDRISPLVYRLVDGLLVPIGGDRARLAADVYGAQQEILADDLDELLADVEIAGQGSMARWVRGTFPLLPEVDVVALIDGSDVRAVPFSRIPGLARTELDPPRFRPTAWPAVGSLL